MKPGKGLVIGGVVVIVAATLLGIGLYASKHSGTSIMAGIFKPAKTLYSGTIEGTMVPVQPEISGRIAELRVQEGQEINAGDVIAVLEPQTAQLNMSVAEDDLKQAESKLLDLVNGSRAEEIRRYRANVDQYQATVDQMAASSAQVKALVARDEENLRHEEKILKDSQTLHDAGALSSRELENEQNKVETLQAQLDSSRAQLDGSQAQIGSVRAQLAAAQANLDQALAGYTEPTIQAQKAVVDSLREKVRLAQVNLDKTVIKSPVRGRVLYKHVELGQVVNTASRLVTILNEQDLWVKVYIPEAELSNMAVGKPAKVSVDAYPEQVFDGQVTQVSDKAEFTPKNVQTKEERTALVFGVKTQLKNGLDLLKPGMPADVAFENTN
ncbi:HlyD family efflux transporter periplasmic adaptor subunit [Heliobacterium chlorum]|uniref:HlyD family efflux transporter periplasmic adaptor subunit n=1 Tax=Heliobacterium chlorum TaxID=2698 RepID=A0ABR7T3N7_HELCL|nr:HlyD family efflux transporter periplasmic adaptor subunit [Heliobacterium chlorum]MBC9785383.1 HlyD family efflux transporter periplasmic adaptor subunit [Heliobacterium chlorum]